jgi:hypothetical protein
MEPKHHTQRNNTIDSDQMPRNIRELVDSQAVLIRDIKNKTISMVQAKEISNAAGKIINACKVEIDYRSVINRDWVIPYLEPDMTIE